MKTLKQLLEERAAIEAELQGLEKSRAAENREFTPEEADRADKLLAQRDELEPQIKAKQDEQNRQRDERMRSALAGGGTRPIRGAEPQTEDRSDPLTNPDGRRYSLMRAINCLVERRQVDGYEGEISQEFARRSGRAAQGFFLPLSLPVERRDFDTTAGAGAIQTTKLMSRFIDLLRNRMVLGALGATVLSDMSGPFDIPKQTSGATAYWVGEGAAPPESAAAIGQVAFSPTTVGAFTDLTRRFLSQQGSLDTENWTRNELIRIIALESDRVGINGSGSGAVPQGILQNSSVSTVSLGTNGAAPTWASMVALESAVASGNADIGNMGYLTSAVGRGKLKTTEKGSAGYPIYLWGDDNRVNGYRALASNQVPSDLTKGSGTNLTSMIFGDFTTVYMAYWSGVDIIIDPYSLSTSGGVRVVALMDMQVKIRHTESLAKIVDMVRT